MTVSTIRIGEILSVRNASLIKLIRNYEYLFKRVAPIKLLTLNRSGRPTIYCNLTDSHIALLLCLMSNSNKTVIAHKYILSTSNSLGEEFKEGG